MTGSIGCNVETPVTDYSFLSEYETGCTDPNAFNYNPTATVNDGSCRYVFDNGFDGFINPQNKYKYMINFDWDNCLFNQTYKLNTDSVVADGVLYTSPSGFVVDGYTIWEALGNGNARCVYATGNYYNFVGNTSTVATVRQGGVGGNSRVLNDKYLIACYGGESVCGGTCPEGVHPSSILCNTFN